MESSICILGAVKEEIAGIKGRMKIDRKSKLGTADVFYGTWERRPIILVRTGIGKIRAGGALAMVLEKYSLSMVISIGYAGGTHPDIQAGDLLVPRQFLSFPKNGEPPMKIDVPLGLTKKAEKVPPSKKFSAYKGRLLTMDRVVNKPEDKRALGETHMVNAIDMETSVLAQIAAVRKVPFLSVRAITDTVNEELIDVSSFMEKNGDVLIRKAGWYVLTHPLKIPKFISLQESARRGTKNITEFLIAFLKLVD